MFRIFRASEEEKQRLLAAASEAPVSSPHALSVAEGILGTVPPGFVHDLSHSQIGQGRHDFDTARAAFFRWQPFDLGWVQIVNQNAGIVRGQLVGVEAHTACLWSVNLSRIVEVLDDPTRFGFMYATTAFHVEQGQERFVIDFNPATKAVSYLIEAISRPRHLLARIGYPFSRAMQHRFARDSHAVMKQYVMDHSLPGRASIGGDVSPLSG